MGKVAWLSRTLVVSPYHICLCRTEKEFQRVLKGLKVPPKDRPEWISPRADATVHFLRNREHEIAVVCLGPMKGRTKAEINALLVHEAVHIWQACRESMGEGAPGSEFEAYSIQAISQALMEAV